MGPKVKGPAKSRGPPSTRLPPETGSWEQGQQTRLGRGRVSMSTGSPNVLGIYGHRYRGPSGVRPGGRPSC